MKGGEVANKDLEVSTSKALMEYLHAVYGQDLRRLPGDTPIWISFSHNDTRGAALSIRALENICKKWCGSSKFHLTRHTFALNLEEVGATTSEIKDELGHKDISTTGRCLKHVKGHRHKYGRKLELLCGFKEEEGEG